LTRGGTTQTSTRGFPLNRLSKTPESSNTSLEPLSFLLNNYPSNCGNSNLPLKSYIRNHVPISTMTLAHRTDITVPIMTPAPSDPFTIETHEEQQREPHPYDASFENELTARILTASNRAPPTSEESRRKERPIPLSSPLRTHTLTIPLTTGSTLPLSTTTPYGSIYGGPNPHLPIPISHPFSHPLDPNPSNPDTTLLLEDARRYASSAGFTSRRQITEVLNRQIEELMREVEGRARARVEAEKENRRIDQEVGRLGEEYEMERGVMMRNMGR
jgi:hypothetical protein